MKSLLHDGVYEYAHPYVHAKYNIRIYRKYVAQYYLQKNKNKLPYKRLNISYENE